jgi:hypothetical protein
VNGLVHPCRCRPTHLGHAIDAAALNAGWRGRDARAPWQFLIVPGYCPRFGWQGGLHPKAIARLERAAQDLRDGLAATVIVSGGAVHSPDNEALLMGEWLVERGGIDRERVLVEPCARHTTTNLRNAGRIVLEAGASEALVVTSDGDWRFFEQAYYLGFPWVSSFHARCIVELGYRVGELAWIGPMHVRFRPSARVFRSSWKETWAGDP